MSKNRYAEQKLNESFENLINSDAFEEFVPPDQNLDFFAALGIKYRELSHSCLLAYLLDPEKPHGLGSGFLRKLLGSLPQAQRLTPDQDIVLPKGLLSAIEEDSPIQVISNTEDDRIDVTLILPDHDLIIGIEVKIDAGEGGRQLERYQDKLVDRNEKHKLMVFLTRHGEPPKTGIHDHSVPCVSMSWGALSQQLASANTDETSRYHDFIKHCVAHFERRLDSNPPQAQAAKTLFKDPVYAHLIRRIMDNDDDLPNAIQVKMDDNPVLIEQFKRLSNHQPMLGEIPLDDIKAMAKRVFPQGFDLDWYPVKTTAKEWKIYPKPDGGLYDVYQPNFMIFHYPNSSWDWERRPAVVLVASNKQLENLEPVHGQLAGHPEGGFLSPNPKGLPKWGHWRHLMATDQEDAPTSLGYVIDNEAFDDDFLKAAEAQLKELDARLQKAWMALDHDKTLVGA